MLDNFITHSSLPMQKIVWAYEGDVTIDPLTASGTVHIPLSTVNLLTPFLIDGIWTSDNWNSSYSINSAGKIDNGGGGGVIAQPYSENARAILTVQINADSTITRIIGFSAYSKFTNLVKYRLWLYLKESATSIDTVSHTASQLANSFQKTTNLAQLNMVDEISVTIHDGSDWTYTHNLGFRPLVKIWHALGGTPYTLATQFNPLSTAQSPISGEPTLIVDDTKIYIRADDNTYSYHPDSDFVIRIYNYGMPL